MKRQLLASAGAAVLLFTAGCGGDDAAGGEGQGDINIGYFPNLDHAAGLVGKQEGFFDQHLEGVSTNYTHFPNGNDFIEALDTGSLDIGYVGPGPAINYYLQGGDVQILSGAANGATLIVSSEDSGIKELEDFDGKSFCTPGNGCTHNVQLEIMLKDLGLESERVGGTVEHQSRVDPASMTMRFQEGEVDAAAAPEPWGTYLVEEYNANVVTEWNDVFVGETLPSVVLVASSEFVDEHPEKVESVLAAHKESIAFIDENEEETLEAVNDYIYELSQQRFSDDVLTNAWERMNISADVDAETLQEWADASYDLQFLDEEPDLDGFVNTELLEEVEEES
ncbi:NitT/TauT family transport system substrate-binding protein [Salsuginibacillus halophilus]|uniref:NitT/TauT family transport system substrate-binding protein n=1 Tax=Salsuginibacillus halophilus TaxID=517424 RepID=A0A2P8HG14_9BACI|nr:aliphatic sulfonate ABC transporter substrate-binding protein [Salsuginibacillus halophilus]PSL45140.1 NitT/TauT family transport system substrate-binding protein [Salsuginibacillus halophilus]